MAFSEGNLSPEVHAAEPGQLSKEQFSIPPIGKETYNGYYVYVATQEEGGKIARAFWEYYGNKYALDGIRSGMLNPAKHEITHGARTGVHPIGDSEKPGYGFFVELSQNGNSLREKTIGAIGRIKSELGL